MSIVSEAERIIENVANAYSVLSAKGATMPDEQNTENLASAIESIQAGEAMSIETVRLICGWQANGLPVGYTLLEYIEGSGTQYINTGVVGRSGLEAELEWEFTSIGSNNAILASRHGSGVRIFLAYHTTIWIYGYSSAVSSSVTAETGVKYSIYCKLYNGEQLLAIDGTTVASGTTASNYYSDALALFANNYKGSGNNMASGKLYSCKIKAGGVLVRDFVPVINPDGEYGLWDKVGEKFYGNIGTGVFTGA